MPITSGDIRGGAIRADDPRYDPITATTTTVNGEIITDESMLNTFKQYEVLVWTGWEERGRLGVPRYVWRFNDLKEAETSFNITERFLCKLLMKYDSNKPDASGDVIKEDWKNSCNYEEDMIDEVEEE